MQLQTCMTPHSHLMSSAVTDLQPCVACVPAAINDANPNPKHRSEHVLVSHGCFMACYVSCIKSALCFISIAVHLKAKLLLHLAPACTVCSARGLHLVRHRIPISSCYRQRVPWSQAAATFVVLCTHLTPSPLWTMAFCAYKKSLVGWQTFWPNI